MPNALLDQSRSIVAEALGDKELGRTAARLDALGIDDAACVKLLREVSEAPASLANLRALRARLEPAAGSFERVLLLRAWRDSLARVPGLPLDDAVKRLICEEARIVAQPSAATLEEFDFERNIFVALSKLATLRRFPAGQLDWEISGMPRSWLAKISPRVLPRVLYWIAVRMGGFAPTYFIHLSGHRKHRHALLERESNRAYYRMAQSIAHQPHIKGLVASSWLHSPDTMSVSPHLKGLNRVFLDSRALVTTMGPAAPNSGVFAKSPERQRLYEEGRFKPTTGLVLWPRAEMLAWAAAHPEFAEAVPLAAQ